MTLHRFHIPPTEWTDGEMCLNATESHHCQEVLRIPVGGKVIVFNGEGAWAEAEIAGQRKREVRVKPLSIRQTPSPEARLILAQAMPKGKTMEWIIEKATELGVSEIYPLVTERTVVRLETNEARSKQEKWQRVAIEACKQCGQNWLPTVHVPGSLSAFMAQRGVVDLALVAAIAPDAQHLKQWLAQKTSRLRSAAVLVGPEGDFSPAELAAAQAGGFLPISLGPIILRAETAAIYSLSVLAHELF